jgi:choline dehydrogenase-like flavoprotein
LGLRGMFIDARRLDEGSAITSEICIIGGGVAGISLALEFEKQGIETCLLESGGFKPDEATRDLYRGESVGIPYLFADGCRSRFFGGSSNCWGGWCRPLDEHDFERREWVPYSGWPFGKAELEPYYECSHSLLELGPYWYEVDFWINAIGNSQLRPISTDAARVLTGISQFSPPARFGKLYRDVLAKSNNVRVYLYANAVNIEAGADQVIHSVKVKTLSGKSLTATAKIFALATGGIENARLLLASNKVRPNGLGNDHDLVGRFFMDHPRLYSGTIHFRKEAPGHMLYDVLFNYHNKAIRAHGTSVAAQFAINPLLQAKEGLLNGRVSFASLCFGQGSEALQALARFKRRLGGDAQFDNGLVHDIMSISVRPTFVARILFARLLRVTSLINQPRFQVIIEPLPDPDSRVTLSQECDRLGVNRVKVDWRLGPQVKRTFDRTLAIIAEELTRAGVADIILDPPIDGEDWPSSFETEGTWHHMGTTRMHDSPRLGVVDRNCCVHGLSNLYVAGSSVFPTGGGNFPTITIVALALRLAHHIAAEVRRPLALNPPVARAFESPRAVALKNIASN